MSKGSEIDVKIHDLEHAVAHLAEVIAQGSIPEKTIQQIRQPLEGLLQKTLNTFRAEKGVEYRNLQGFRVATIRNDGIRFLVSVKDPVVGDKPGYFLNNEGEMREFYTDVSSNGSSIKTMEGAIAVLEAHLKSRGYTCNT